LAPRAQWLAAELGVVPQREGIPMSLQAQFVRFALVGGLATALQYAILVVLGALGVEVVFNHADYRLLTRRALSALASHGERNLFLRGIIPQLGFPSAIVTYDRAERFAGESQYPLRKMLSFVW
jgi:hypothetical protein